MIKLYGNGVYLVNGSRIIEDDAEAASVLNAECGSAPSKEEAAKGTMAYKILEEHNTSGDMQNLHIKFDKLTSHDITFVSRQHAHQGLRSSLFLMYLQIVITACVQ